MTDGQKLLLIMNRLKKEDEEDQSILTWISRYKIQTIIHNINQTTNNIDSLQQESTQYLYQSRLNQYLQEIDNQTANEVYKNEVDSRKKAAREAVDTREIPKSNKHWWNPKIGELIEGKKKLLSKMAQHKRSRGL
ncbi:hypothetical protein ILUMI_04025 [Ignelater luminosus]|uniref:Uncharacterized protein n=1 Tax=Ignelater luminosus TaxID=2038154 RepID=A0A8K0DFI3_IGNLU|nr:hypothetical protein ILUMI_04025 [Ignelater luminosus]